MIWRCLLVPAEATIAELHAVLQITFGWTGTHLHRFVIHSTEYGIAYLGGIGFRDDAREIRLSGFGFRVGERFVYDYDLTDGWRLDLRVEQILPAQPGRTYPRCVGGRRASPPEGCGGPWVFLEQTAPHLVFAAVARAAEIVGQLLENDLATLAEHRDEFAGLLPLLGLERFDHRGLNRALACPDITERSVV